MKYTQTIRDQYPKEAYDLNIQSVKFSSDATFDSAIGVCFQEQLGNWLFSLQGGKDKKVSESNSLFTTSLWVELGNHHSYVNNQIMR